MCRRTLTLPTITYKQIRDSIEAQSRPAATAARRAAQSAT
jgi:hypothetical protein